MKTINTLLISRHSILCEGIKCLFGGTAFEVVCNVANSENAVSTLKEGLQVDLTISEVCDDFADFVHFVRRSGCSTKIVVLAAYQNPFPPNFPFREVDGLLGQYVSPATLMRSLELVMSGEQIYPFDAAFLHHLREPEEPAIEISKELDDLSWREIEILRCLALGHPNKTIARQLQIAETTVKAHVKTILRKTKAVNRTQAAMWSISRGLRASNMTVSASQGVARDNEIEIPKLRAALSTTTIEVKRVSEPIEVRNGSKTQVRALDGASPSK